MIRSAAGSAGADGSGRLRTHPAASPVAPRIRTRALRSAAVLLVAAATALAGPLPPAVAAPGDAEPGSAEQTVVPTVDDATSPERPVQIQVGRFEPRTVTPGTDVTVTGTLTNTGTETITDLHVRLQRGAVLRTRAALAAVGRDGVATTEVTPEFTPLGGGDLPPRASVPFSYTLPADRLQVDAEGIYPVLLNVNGEVEGTERRVGELSTFVVRQPVAPARTRVAWLWPLTERTHRDAAGNFLDDQLARSIADGGRLDRALAVLERLPVAAVGPDRRPAPGQRVTLAVDPALLEELQVMAAGPYAVGGEAGAGTGTEAAVTYLERLRVVAGVHQVAVLPYGDVDADALQSAGLTDVLTRSLPGTPQGTAEDPPGSSAEAAAPAPAPTSGPGPAPAEPAADDGTGDGGDAARDTPSEAVPAEGGEPAADGAEGTAPADGPGTGAGARIVADALGVTPRTDLAWPAGGAVSAATLGELYEGGARQVVLDADALTRGARLAGLTEAAATPRTTVQTPAGPLEALIADPVLSAVASSAEVAAGGPRMAEQRYLAELAALAMQTPRRTEQTVLVAPARGLQAGLDGAGAMMADTAGLPWLAPASVADVARGPSGAPGRLQNPSDARGLDPRGLAALAEGVASRDDLASAVVTDPATVLQAYDAAISRAASSAWRGDAAAQRAAAADVRTTLDRLRSRVSVLAPAEGTYTLASSDADLVVTMHNDLPFAVQVLLDLQAPGTRALAVEKDIGRQVLPPGARTTVEVPTEVRQSGGFTVTAVLNTPDGGALGEQVAIEVRSTAYGPISLAITIGAASLLALLFLRRLLLFVLRRRRAPAGADGELPPRGPEGAAVALPPTRSPV